MMEEMAAARAAVNLGSAVIAAVAALRESAYDGWWSCGCWDDFPVASLMSWES